MISFDQLSKDSDALDRSGGSRGWKLGLGLGVAVALGAGFVAGRVERREPNVDRTGPVSVRLPGADTGLDSAVLVATTPTDRGFDARMWLIGPSVEVGVLDGEASPHQKAEQAMLVADTVISLTAGQVALRSVTSDRAEVLSMNATSLVAVPAGPNDPESQRVGVVDDESLWMLDPTDSSTLTQRELPDGVVAIVGSLDASTFVVETDTIDAVPRWAQWTPRGTLEPLDSRISDDDDVIAVAGATIAVQRDGVLHLLTIGTDQGVTIDLSANDLRDASRGCLGPIGRFMLIPSLNGRIAVVGAFPADEVSPTDATVVFTTHPGTQEAGWVGPGQIAFTHVTGYPILEQVDLYTSTPTAVATWPSASAATLLVGATPCITST